MNTVIIILLIVFAVLWLYLVHTLILMVKVRRNKEFKEHYLKKRGHTVEFMIKANLAFIAFVTIVLGLLWCAV
jgi:hypothetical protein